MEHKLPPLRGIKQIELLAKLMDNQFSIPGTNIRFGLDAILGLIPGVGDLSTFAVSGYMLLVMAKNGASSFVIARMVVNILVDTLFGSIPILGDLFDVAFKANIRNLRLMQQHYKEGRQGGSAWKVIFLVLGILFFAIIVVIWLVYKLVAELF